MVFAPLKVCVKESSNMILQCGSMDDEAFQSLVAKHPVSQPNFKSFIVIIINIHFTTLKIQASSRDVA